MTGQTAGYAIEKYDPEHYKQTGKAGGQHVKSFRTREQLEAALEKRESGGLRASAESSHEPRTYVEQTIITPKGKRVRRHVTLQKFV